MYCRQGTGYIAINEDEQTSSHPQLHSALPRFAGLFWQPAIADWRTICGLALLSIQYHPPRSALERRLESELAHTSAPVIAAVLLSLEQLVSAVPY
jgi:hypothetical protein